MKEIILYFSRPGNNYVNGTIKNLSVGNTEIAASMIHKLTEPTYLKSNLSFRIPKTIRNV